MGRRIALYSLFPVLLIVIGTVAFLQFGLSQTETVQAKSVTEPTSAQTPPAIDEKVAEEQKKKEEQARKEAEEKEAQQRAAEQQSTTAEQQTAAQQQATTAQQSTTEQQAAAEPASEQDGWRENAAERESPVPEQATGTEQPAPEQAAAPTSSALSLTVPKMGLYNNPVTNSIAPSVLAQGAGKAPSTGFPWQEGANTYIAAHVYGYEGTGSWQQFADLPSMAQGDIIKLTDGSGTTYTYQVSNIMTVAPTDTWVMEPTGGGTTVSLQTCVGPNWGKRMIVQGSLVSTA